MRDYFKILRYVFPYKKLVFASIIFNLLFAFFELFSVVMIIPFLGILFNTKPLVTEMPAFSFSANYFIGVFNYFLSWMIIQYSVRTALLAVCVIIVSMTFFKSLTRYLSLHYLAPVRNGVMTDLRNKMFGKIIDLPLSFFSEERKGDIISRISNDVNEVEVSLVSTFEIFFKDPIIIVVHLIVLLYMSPALTLFVFLLLPVSSYIIGIIGKRLRRVSMRGQMKLGLITSMVEEAIYGLRIIKAFNAKKKIKSRFESTTNLYKRIMIKIFRRRALASPISEFLGTVVIVAILLYGSYLVLKETPAMKPEELIGYLAIFYLIITPAKAFSTVYYQIQKGLASIDRINGVLHAEISIKDEPDAIEVKEFTNSIEFKNVSFKYVNDWVLQDISFRIEKGKTLAIVGESGSGKSTLVDLIPRFIDYEQGEILFDGISLKKYKIADLRNLMGIVTQQSILFNDSVFNNISFGLNNTSTSQVIEAAKVANAHEFIMQMPLGYHTNIGDMGNKLSGGQRQRITIARAILKNPPLLILDEATSALDTVSEKLVQEAMNNLCRNRTSIIIAHRLSTIQHADEILVLDKGRIVERGKHEELIKKEGIYKKLVDLQMFN